MKPRFELGFLLLTLLLSVDTQSSGRQRVFWSEANGYSVSIPQGWNQVPEGLVGDILKGTFFAEGVAVRDCEAVLCLNRDGGQFDFPCLIIKVTKYSDLGATYSPVQNEINVLLKSVLRVDTGTLDEKSMICRSNIQGKTIATREYLRMTVGYLGRYGTVQLMFYCLKSDWSHFEQQRNLLFNSFSFDEGMRYKDAPRGLGRGSITHVAYAIAAAVFGLVFVFPRMSLQKRAGSYEVSWP